MLRRYSLSGAARAGRARPPSTQRGDGPATKLPAVLRVTAAPAAAHSPVVGDQAAWVRWARPPAQAGRPAAGRPIPTPAPVCKVYLRHDLAIYPPRDPRLCIGTLCDVRHGLRGR